MLIRKSEYTCTSSVAATVDTWVYIQVDLSVVSTTIRISEATRARFAELAKMTGRPMTELVDEAADALERRIFFDRLDERYADLRGDAEAWAEIDSERAIEERSLPD